MAEKPEDLNLPNSVIARIIKEALPDGVNISKESKAAISKAASVFVLYCTSCANNFAMQQKRKTLKDVDVFSALEDMDFEIFVPQLKDMLESFKKEQKDKRVAVEKRRKAKEANISENDIKNANNEAIMKESDNDANISNELSNQEFIVID